MRIICNFKWVVGRKRFFWFSIMKKLWNWVECIFCLCLFDGKEKIGNRMILVVGYKNLDSDSICSVLVVVEFLKVCGLEVKVVC